MSQYNKTVLTRAGLELAKRANAGQAKFGITRTVTSADDWSHKTVQDLEEVTTIPNIMQQGTIMDANEVESNNSVIGVSLCFTNKNLSTGYQIRIIGLYVKEEGQENDFLYAVTTAITPEYMPSFADKVFYKFNMKMYCVIGKAQAVNVVIDDGTAVTHGQFDKYKDAINKSIEAVAEAHTEDMKKVVKSATINGGAKVTPDGDGNLALVVPDPDLSDLAHKSELIPKADKTYVDDKVDAIDFGKIKFHKRYIDANGQKADGTWSATKNDDGTYTIDLYNDDWTAYKLADVLAQLPNKVDTSTVNAQVQDAKNTATLRADNLQNQINSKLNYYYVGDGYDVLSSDGKWGIIELNNAQNLKNLPPMGNKTWTHILKLLRYGWGVVLVYSQDNTIWQNSLNGNTWSGWVRLATTDDVNARLSLAGGNMNQRSTINWNGGGINDRTGNLGGLHWEGGTDRVDLFADQDGNDNLDLVIQLGGDNSNSVVIRNASGAQVARIDVGGNITSPTITALQNQVNDLINQINYIKANYVEGRTFPASQEAQATSWENANPQRIAFITK